MAAKTKVQDIAIFITRINISSAFDKIYRDELFQVVDFWQRPPLMLKWKIPKQPLCWTTLCFNRALQQIKNEIQKEPIDCRDINPRWVEKMESSIPEKIVYADDCDFITEIEKTKDKIYEKAK